MVDVIISTLIQMTVFIGLPFICYLIFVKEKTGFFKWIGLYIPNKATWIKSGVVVFFASMILMVGTLIVFLELGVISKDMLNSFNISEHKFSIEFVFIVLIKAIFQTALSEEIFFRGFIGKTIARKFGYIKGNIIQAIMFGLPHGLPFILVYKAYAFGVAFFISAAIAGFMHFYLNEKQANGSILPSITVHGIMNVMSFLQ